MDIAAADIEVLELLSQKRELFSQIEQVSQDMSIHAVEQLVTCMEQRQKLMCQIDVIDDQIRANCAQSSDMLDAVNLKASRGELPPPLARLYDAALSVRAIANRIMKNEESIKCHLEFEKQRITEKIEELNHSGPVVADRYYRSVQTGINKPLDVGTGKLI